MAELIKIRGCDRPERRADVIFVHGLNGNPGKYWSHNDEPTKFWPAWMGEDLPDVGVWSLGYENAALKPRWSGPRSGRRRSERRGRLRVLRACARC